MMQINSFNNSNNIAFCGERLFPVKLIKNASGFAPKVVEGFFTKMTPDDAPLVKEVLSEWKKTDFGADVFNIFLANGRYNGPHSKNLTFMIECPQFEKPLEKIRAIASVVHYDYPRESSLYISYLQSASQINAIEKFKGAGDMMLRAIAQFARQINAERIEVYPINDRVKSWYRTLKFENGLLQDYLALYQKDYSKLEEHIEEKYKTGCLYILRNICSKISSSIKEMLLKLNKTSETNSKKHKIYT